MPVFNNMLAGASGGAGAGGFAIERSLRFNKDDSAYLSRTPSSAGNRQQWTWSGWVKRCGNATLFDGLFGADLGISPRQDNIVVFFWNDDQTTHGGKFSIGDGAGAYLRTDVRFRDPGAWAHLLIVTDTTLATVNDRIKIYWNGVRITEFEGNTLATNVLQNSELGWNTNTLHVIGANKYNGTYESYLNGYLADVHSIDGQTLAPTDFGELDNNGVWQPKKYTGNYNISNIIYSNYLTAVGGFVSGEGATNAFDSSTSTRAKAAAADSIITFDLSSLSLTGSFEFYATNAASEYSLDGGTTWTSSAANSYTTATSDISGVSNIKLKPSSGTTMKVTAFKNQGTILIDNSGANSFHLDFADNSSNAALGFDSSSTGLNRIETGSVINGVPVLGSMTFTGHSNAQAANLRDNDLSTLSADGGGLNTSTNMGYDLLIPYKVRKIRTIGASSNGGSTNDGVFNIQYSDDNITWTTVTGSNTTHTISAGLGNTDETTIDDNGAHRYWRLYYSSSTGTGGNIWLSSLDMFADDIGANNWFVNNLTASDLQGQLYSQASGTSESAFSNTNFVGNFPAESSGNHIYDVKLNTSVSTVTFSYQYGFSGVEILVSNDGTNWTSKGVQTQAYTTISDSNPFQYVRWYIAASWVFGITNNPANIDSLVDTPTNGDTASDTGAGGEITGNYATWNPIDKGSAITLTNGNLDIAQSGSSFCKATIAVSSGKWFWEIFKTDAVDSIVGIALASTVADVNYLGSITGTAGATTSTGSLIFSSPFSQGGSGTIGAMSNGSIIGFALDCDNGTLKLYLNGSLLTANHFTFSPGLLITPALGTNVSAGAYPTNFGQRTFAYAIPSGYKSLNTANLSPTVADGSKYFDIALDTGANILSAATGKTDNAGFVWIKDRDNNSTNHILFNKVNDEGMDGTPHLRSNEVDTEATCGTYAAPSGNSVGWVWNAGDSTTLITAGGLNSSIYDQSQTWSGQITGSNYSGYPKTQAFNNDIADYCLAGEGSELVFTPSPSFSSATTVKIWYYMPTTHANAIKINGTGVASNVATTASVLTHTFTVSGFTSLSWSRSYYDAEDVGIARIDVDGAQLVDFGVSAPNVPSITSTVRANPSAGFSIVKASVAATLTGGPTLAHGLNKKPEFIIGKNLDSTIYWYAYHKDLPDSHYLIPHLASVQQNSGAVWGTHDSLDSTIFRIGDGTPSSMWIPSGTNDCIFYLWTSVEGYSAIGSYIGNGLPNGVFIHTGFTPSWILFKRSDSSSDWTIYDTARDPHNVAGNKLEPNTPDQESPEGAVLDILSNGFKFRRGSLENGGNDVYIYVAFASNPFASNGGIAR